MLSTTDFLRGFPLAVMLFALPLTGAIAWGLIVLYRRRVIRLMAAAAGQAPVTQPPEPPSAAPRPPLTFKIINPANAPPETHTKNSLYNAMHRRLWRIVAIYALGGVGYAALMAVILLSLQPITRHPLAMLTLTLTFLWPFVLVLWSILGHTHRSRAIILGGYALLYLALGIEGSLSGSIARWSSSIQLWQSVNLQLTIALILVMNRKIRAIGPLVLVLLTFLVAGVLGLIYFIGNNGAWFIALAKQIGLNLQQANLFSIGAIVIGTTGMGLTAWAMLLKLKKLYTRQKISDQILSSAVIFALCALHYAVFIASEDTSGLLYGLAACLCPSILVWGGFALARRGASQTPPVNLLLLRVFSLGRRSAQLHDALSSHWRSIGNLRMIAGPDLAATTIESHEFLDFLSGKLNEYFIASHAELQQRLTEAADQPDPDGRYRVTEYFCFADTWKMVLGELAARHDVVLMDLRSFSPQNAGCIYEINTLLDLVPLEKILLITDTTTDQALLQQTAIQAWAKLPVSSPNRTAGKELRLYDFRKSISTEIPGLLRALTQVVGS